ncbi:MAG: hypothetical protein ACRDDH_11920 [Cetobacterium sp.]|uniref:hypothetical protein n=1 Tax=Cetobacterium sp. TaxID=2071632 RepID=UPI003EE5DA53
MILEAVAFLSPRRVKVTISKDDEFEAFMTNENGKRRISFEGIPHILYKNEGQWNMIEEDLYELQF